MIGYTRMMAEYSEKFTYNDIPSEVVKHSKIIMLDTLGAMIVASDQIYPAGRIICEYICSQGGREDSTIVGYDVKVPASNAALVNGTYAYMFDIESYHAKSVLHETAVTLPSGLATGEIRDISGKELITSFVLGVDLESRLSYAISPSLMYDRGFHPSVVVGSIGSTISAGKSLNLKKEQYVNAIGLAAQQASGLLSWENDHTEMTRPFGIGIAARNGVTAAMLAERGFAGPEVLEGKYTIFDAFSGEKHPEELLNELGQRFEVMNQTIKLYSSCAFTHPGLDAFLSLVNENNLTGDSIEQIIIKFPSTGAKLIDSSNLKSHNIQYVIAVAAYKRGISIEDILFTQKDERIWRLSKNIKLIYDESLNEYFPETMPTVVKIKTKGGGILEKSVDSAKGTPENPLSPKEIIEKYYSLVTKRLNEATAEKIAHMILNLDDVDNINELTELLKLNCIG